MNRISKNIVEFFSDSPLKTEQDIETYLKRSIKTICKPCWKLKYCPYGYLVEDFPLPGITKSQAEEHITY